MLTLYKILSFIIMPISYFVLVCIFMAMPMAFANPQILLGLAFMICLFLYSFFSFRFNSRAVIGNNPVKSNLKDWIKINSYVTFFQQVMLFISIIFILTNQSSVETQFRATYNQMEAMQTSNLNMTYPQFIQFLNGFFEIILVVSAIFIAHIILTWRLLRAYHEYFTL